MYVTIGLLVLEVGFYGWLSHRETVLQNQIADLDQESRKAEQELAGVKPKLAIAVNTQKQLKNIGVILDQKIFWTKVLAELEKYTYKPITYTTMHAEAKSNSLSISGITQSYTDIGKLMLGLKQSANVEDVSLTASGQGAKTAEIGYNFTIKVTLNPKLFRR